MIVARTKALPAEDSAEYRARLRAIIAKQYKGVEADAATALQISQSYLNQFLNGHKGAGGKMIRAIERIEGIAGAPPNRATSAPRVELPIDGYRGPPVDAISEDWAMRWRALQELVKQGRDPAVAYAILAPMKFDGEQRTPTWGDYFSRAVDELDGAPAEVVAPKQLQPASRGRRR